MLVVEQTRKSGPGEYKDEIQSKEPSNYFNLFDLCCIAAYGL